MEKKSSSQDKRPYAPLDKSYRWNVFKQQYEYVQQPKVHYEKDCVICENEGPHDIHDRNHVIKGQE